mmetsp:Transcript_9001/g.18189  ORF Transcript_9001/g.18189 Transcript_9001/m.18189 type:complete len:241 (+) Transcript_9001:207-929(+)
MLPSPSPPLTLKAASISSITTTWSSLSLPLSFHSVIASPNNSLTNLSLPPTQRDKSSGAFTTTGFLDVNKLDISLAIIVFPQPGGPYKRIPFGDFTFSSFRIVVVLLFRLRRGKTRRTRVDICGFRPPIDDWSWFMAGVVGVGRLEEVGEEDFVGEPPLLPKSNRSQSSTTKLTFSSPSYFAPISIPPLKLIGTTLTLTITPTPTSAHSTPSRLPPYPTVQLLRSLDVLSPARAPLDNNR